MKNITALLIPALLVAALIVGSDTLFILNENEQAVITQFGGFVRKIQDPGLNYKAPFIQSVIFYDKRILDHDVQPQEVVTQDKRTLVVDNFSKWRIVDPEKFYKRAKTERVAEERLRDIIYSELRQDFGAHDLADIISSKRAELMRLVTERANAKVKDMEMGVEIIDVRIKRADLPPANQQAVFNRMREERKRIARQFRSKGDEEAQKIRATTDQEKAVILSEAYRTEQDIRGKGDAESIKINAEAFGQNPQFYEFLRTLEAYRNSITDQDRMILTQKSPFLKYLREP
jgi:membrane protease subunit HflC